VVPEGDKVACDRLPTEILRTLTGPGKQYCSTQQAEQKVPSKRDISFYLRFVEAPCVVSIPDLHPDAISTYIFSSAEKPLADIDAFDSLKWDQLAKFEQHHADDLHTMESACQHIADSYDGNLIQILPTQQQHDIVTRMKWWTTPVKHPLAKALGHVHSMIEVEAGDKSYVLEVLPASLGVHAGAKLLTNALDGHVYADADQSQIRSSLTVSDVLNSLREHEEDKYDLLDNNCHAMIRRTFQWAAPDVTLPESPNSNWELLASKVNSVSPTSFQTLLELSGATQWCR
jgi:hypothetical protein